MTSWPLQKILYSRILLAAAASESINQSTAALQSVASADDNDPFADLNEDCDELESNEVVLEDDS